MIRACLCGLAAAVLLPAGASAQVLFSYEDLDPGIDSPVGGGLTITSSAFDAERIAVGTVDVGLATGPFMSLVTDPLSIDVSTYIGKSFSAFAETNIPTTATINTGDSIYLQVDYFNDAVGAAGAGNFVRSTAGFYNDASTRDTWLPLAIDGFVPATTDNGGAVDRANVSVVLTDGGFGGTPNDSGSGTFTLLDNFSYTISEPAPPSSVFFSEMAPTSDNMVASGVILDPAVDPLDASNDVGLVFLEATGNFVNVNIGAPVDVSTFEGQKFRAAFDYLVPANTVLESGDDTFWAQIGFNDPASGSAPQGAGNSTSAGFPVIDNVADGVWRTIEVTGTIPPDTNGATFSITTSDDGFPGNAADAIGVGYYIDNVIFEALEVESGDYNNDGVVDAADYTVYRDNLGAEAPSGPPFAYRDSVDLGGERSINFAGDGVDGVTVADQAVWAANYGASSAPSGAAVPEPTSVLLLLVGGVSASWRRGVGGPSSRS